MELDLNANNLPAILNSDDCGEVIKALQYLIANLYLANTTEINDCVKKLTQSTDVGVRFWAKKLSNSIGQYETEQANAQVAAIPKDLPVDILIQKLQSVASTYLSLDVIKKLCESKKPEAQDFLKNYLASCNDNIQISYLTKNIGIYFPSEENLLFLMPYLKHEDDRVVANTIEGIELIGSPKGVIVLSQLLDHKSNRVRTNAAIALGKFDAEKSFAVISKMLAPEAGAHFRISACHAIKTLRDPKFLEQLESTLLDDTTFSAALDSIAAIGGQPAIALLTKNYSQIPASKQSQVDSIAAKLSRLEEKPLERLGERILSSEACAKANVVVEEYSEKLNDRIDWLKTTYYSIKSYCEYRSSKLVLGTAIFFAIVAFFSIRTGSNTPPITARNNNTASATSSLAASDSNKSTQVTTLASDNQLQLQATKISGNNQNTVATTANERPIQEVKKIVRDHIPLYYPDSLVEEIVSSLYELRRELSEHSQMGYSDKTALGKEEICKVITGKWVLFDATIMDVVELKPSGYRITALAEPKEIIFREEGSILHFNMHDKEIALSLQPDTKIEVLGKTHAVVKKNRFELLGQAVEGFQIDFTIEEPIFTNAIQYAILTRNPNLLKHLLAFYKYNPNIVDFDSFASPLHNVIAKLCSSSNDGKTLEMAKLLIDFGANVNAQDDEKKNLWILH